MKQFDLLTVIGEAKKLNKLRTLFFIWSQKNSMPLKDVEARKQYNREARHRERVALKEYDNLKQKLKACSNLDAKVDALIASSNFADIGAVVQLLAQNSMPTV